MVWMGLHEKALMMIVIMGAIAFNPGIAQSKANDDQNEIILLNDTASALEDTNPELSRSLAKFADEKEKEWEVENANKNAPVTAVINKDQLQYRVNLLKAAALAIQPTYPLIAQSLDKMAKDLNRTIETIEIEK